MGQYYRVKLGASYDMPYGQERERFDTKAEAQAYADAFNENQEALRGTIGFDMRNYTMATVEGPFEEET